MLLLNDPSIQHMREAITAGIDANPPLFFYLYRFLSQSISNNPIFLKIISIFFFSAAISGFYYYVTRLIQNAVINYILFGLVIILTSLNYNLSSQIRQYSIFLLISCLYFIITNELIKKPTQIGLLIGQFFTGLCLAFIHNYGLIYLAACLSFSGLLFLWSKQKTYLVPIAVGILIAGLWFIIWYPSFLIQAETGKPVSWIPVPTFASFITVADSLIPRIPVLNETNFGLQISKVLLVVGTFGYISFRKLRRDFDAFRSDRAFSFYLLSGYIFWTTMGLTLLISLTYTSIFFNRYFWPSHLLFLFQFVYAVAYFSPKFSLRRFPILTLSFFSCAIALYLFRQNRKISLFPNHITQLSSYIKNKKPIFFESIDEFLPANYYRLLDSHYLLNWEASLKTSTTVHYKTIQYIREKYGISKIIPRDQFTPVNFPNFYVIDNVHFYQFEHLIAKKQIRVVRTIPTSVSGYQILECAHQIADNKSDQ